MSKDVLEGWHSSVHKCRLIKEALQKLDHLAEKGLIFNAEDRYAALTNEFVEAIEIARDVLYIK